ncbi:17974_t:CDS:1, partial [Racocetra fulgida]
LFDDSLTIEIEDTTVDVYLEKELDEELLQISTKAVDIDMEDELTIENLFNI